MATWKSVPDFGDEKRTSREWVHEASGAKVAEVLYDAHDRNGNPSEPDPTSEADGHGRWLGMQVGESWQTLLWKHPRKSGGKLEYGYGCTRGKEPLEELEGCLARKRALVDKARAIADTHDLSGANVRAMGDLMQEWKKVRTWHVPAENGLWEAFHAARHDFFDAREDQQKQAKVAKEALATEAEAVLSEKDFRHGSERMRDLMERWKATPSAGRDDDQALWKRFNGARNEFFKAQHENYEQRKQRSAEAREKKERLIIRATAISDAQDYSRGAADNMKGLMDEWKAAGTAGHERDNELWTRFRAAQQPFWDGRKVARERDHAEWEKRHAAWLERMEKVIAGKAHDIERIDDDINYLEFKLTCAEGEDALADVERKLASARDRRTRIQDEIDDIKRQMKE